MLRMRGGEGGTGVRSVVCAEMRRLKQGDRGALLSAAAGNALAC